MEGETVWLSREAMADLFQKDVRTISDHIRNIFEEGELRPEAVVRNFRITAADNKPYDTHDPEADASKLFFQTVQKKMHWAIGQTAAEIVHARASAAKPQMGLTSWSGDQPRKGDVRVAKNYLNKDEIKALNLTVSAYLDFADLVAACSRDSVGEPV